MNQNKNFLPIVDQQKIHETYIREYTNDEILAVAIEEMSELTKHLTKIMRKKEPLKDNAGCLEEMADIQICINTLKLYMDIPEDEMQHAISEKLRKYQ